MSKISRQFLQRSRDVASNGRAATAAASRVANMVTGDGKLGVAAAAAKQARPVDDRPLCHSVAHYYNAAGEMIAAPAVKAAQ